MVDFSKYVKMYESYKDRNDLGTGITRSEIKELRESYATESKKERIMESRRGTGYAKRLEENAKVDSERKSLKEKADLKDSRMERINALREARENSVVAPVKGVDKVVATLDEKKAQEARSARIQSIREARVAKPATSSVEKKPVSNVNEKINEARSAYFKARKALREGDMGMAGEQAGIATQAVDAVNVNQTVVSPEVLAIIEDLKNKVDNLATTVGIVPADTGMTAEADPNAGVPAQVGQPLDQVQVMESAQLTAVKARIAERKAMMAKTSAEVEALNESEAGQAQILAVMKATTPKDMSLATVDKKESVLPKMPSVAEIVKGTAKGVERWPNKAIKKDPSAALLGKGITINEAEKPLDEQMVDKVLNEEKLNFRDIYRNGALTK